MLELEGIRLSCLYLCVTIDQADFNESMRQGAIELDPEDVEFKGEGLSSYPVRLSLLIRGLPIPTKRTSKLTTAAPGLLLGCSYHEKNKEDHQENKEAEVI